MAEDTKPLIDEWIDVPENYAFPNPTKIHIFIGKHTRDNADQYASALHVARNVPFESASIGMTDILVLYITREMKIQDGNHAIRLAQGYYDKWIYEIQKQSWILAILEDNDFDNVPQVWEEAQKLRGLDPIPEPKYDLNYRVEHRLKQILDFLSVDIIFQARIMSRINDALAKIISGVEDETNKAGFQPDTANADLHPEIESGSANDGNRRTRTARKS